MTIRLSNPEIITVNSEALETQIRDLLPSQNGFGSELQASNVITPIIDLTAAAEGSGLATDLARALAFGSQTAFDENSSSSVLANSPGWYRIFACATLRADAGDFGCSLTMTDGATIKTIWAMNIKSTADNGFVSQNIDLIVGLSTGESVTAVATGAQANFVGSIRQVADSTGLTVNPNGLPL